MKKKTVLLRAAMATLIGFAVLFGLSHYQKPSDARKLGLQLLKDQNYQLGLVNLRQFGQVEDLHAIAPLLDNEDPDVQSQAILTMENLSGHSIRVPAGLSGTGAESMTTGCGLRIDQTEIFNQYVSNWKDWWKRQKADAIGS